MFTGLFRNSDFRSAIEGAAKIGYEGIEIRFHEPHMSVDSGDGLLKEYAVMIKDSGITPAALYSFTGNYSVLSDRDIEKTEFPNAKRVFEAACILGAPLVKISAGGPSPHKAQDYHYEKAAFWLRRTAELAGTFGLKILFEIHEGALVETADSAMRLVNMVGCDNAGLIHDPGNMYISGTPYGDSAVKLLGGKIFHVHIKDIRLFGNENAENGKNNKNGKVRWEHAQLNTGEVDHQSVFRALREIGFTGYLSTEVNIAGLDPADAARHEFIELRKMIDACG